MEFIIRCLQNFLLYMRAAFHLFHPFISKFRDKIWKFKSPAKLVTTPK